LALPVSRTRVANSSTLTIKGELVSLSRKYQTIAGIVAGLILASGCASTDAAIKAAGPDGVGIVATSPDDGAIDETTAAAPAPDASVPDATAELDDDDTLGAEDNDAAALESGDGAAAIQDISVVETMTIKHPRSDGRWEWAAILENPNEGCLYRERDGWSERLRITIEAYDADNLLLDSDSAILIMLPGTTAIEGWFSKIGSHTIDRLEVKVLEAQYATCDYADYGTMEFSNVSLENSRTRSTVSGVATSSFDADQERVRLVAIIRDIEGNPIGWDGSYVDRLPAGGSARFELRILDKYPADSAVDVYGYLWG